MAAIESAQEGRGELSHRSVGLARPTRSALSCFTALWSVPGRPCRGRRELVKGALTGDRKRRSAGAAAGHDYEFGLFSRGLPGTKVVGKHCRLTARRPEVAPEPQPCRRSLRQRPALEVGIASPSWAGRPECDVATNSSRSPAVHPVTRISSPGSRPHLEEGLRVPLAAASSAEETLAANLDGMLALDPKPRLDRPRPLREPRSASDRQGDPLDTGRGRGAAMGTLGPESWGSGRPRRSDRSGRGKTRRALHNGSGRDA